MKPAKKTQSEKFIDKAKELECDENEEVFTRKLRKIAEQKEKPAK